MKRRSKESGHPESETAQRPTGGADHVKTLHILRKSLEEAHRAEGRDAREVLHEIAFKYGIAIGP